MLLGCAAPPPKAPAAPVNDLEFERFVATQLPFDAALLKGGDWALYTLKAQGVIRPEHYKWSVVTADVKGLWIENKVPHAETGMITKSRYDRAGKPVEIWMGPPGGVPAQVWPKPGTPMAPPARAAAPPPLREEAEPVAAAGRTFRCVKVTSEATRPDGRKIPVVSWFSSEVPFAGQARYGGLVKRQAGRVTMELVDSGNAPRPRPELEIPK
ncbi:MAG TPA: hypothetical protein VF950_00715 [Planctomycetota bacterium]